MDARLFFFFYDGKMDIFFFLFLRKLFASSLTYTVLFSLRVQWLLQSCEKWRVGGRGIQAHRLGSTLVNASG